MKFAQMINEELVADGSKEALSVLMARPKALPRVYAEVRRFDKKGKPCSVRSGPSGGYWETPSYARPPREA